MNPMLPSGIDVQKSDAKTVFDVVTNIYKQGYGDIQMVVGSDRINEFDKLINKYNGIKARHGYYKFKSIKEVFMSPRFRRS